MTAIRKCLMCGVIISDTTRKVDICIPCALSLAEKSLEKNTRKCTCCPAILDASYTQDVCKPCLDKTEKDGAASLLLPPDNKYNRAWNLGVRDGAKMMKECPPPPSDPVNHPAHYNSLGATCSKCKEPIECNDVKNRMKGNLADALKYIWRCEYKGKKRQDIQKAIWYLQDELKRSE